MFMKLPSNSKQLLQEILGADNPTQLISEKFNKCSIKDDGVLRSLLRELIQEGYIRIPAWADNVPYSIEVNNSARTYMEREAEYERQLLLSASKTYHIDTIMATGSNIVLGDVINSSLGVDIAIKRIISDIAEKGDKDKEALAALLEEAKEIIENINATRQIPKNTGFFSRLSSHLDKHGWFYGAIINLLGTSAFTLLQGK